MFFCLGKIAWRCMLTDEPFLKIPVVYYPRSMSDSVSEPDDYEDEQSHVQVLDRVYLSVLELMHMASSIDVENPDKGGQYARLLQICGEKENVLSVLTKLTALLAKLHDVREDIGKAYATQAHNQKEKITDKERKAKDQEIIRRFLENQGYEKS